MRPLKNPSKRRQTLETVAERSRGLAEYERQYVTADRLASTIQEYIDCRAFSYWMRLVAEVEGCLSEFAKSAIERRCPGFLSYANAYRRQHPQEREFLWTRLIEWSDENFFAFAKREGWAHALGYYAARDPRMDQIRAWWRECDARWKVARPHVFPSFEEWCLAASAHSRSVPPGPSS